MKPEEFAAKNMIPQEWALNMALQFGRSTLSAAELIKAFEELGRASPQRMKPKKRRSGLVELRESKRKKRIRRKRERQNKRLR